nr:PQQ-like beta-propeller repeat protein [Chloroflexota bacterium]
VYVTVDNMLLAFNTTHGEPLWSVKIHDGFADTGGELAHPVLANGRLYFVLQNYASNSNLVWMTLEAFDASSGHVLWHYRSSGLIEELAVDNDTIYISVPDFSKTNTRNVLLALNATDGSQRWSTMTNASHVTSEAILNADSHMVVKNGVIYQLLSSPVCGEKNGACLFAYRAENGALLWHSPNLLPAFAQKNDFAFRFEGSLIAAGNALYIESRVGLCAIDASTGQLLWRQSEGSTVSLTPANQALNGPFAGKGNPGTSFVVAGSTIFHIEMTEQGNYLTTLHTSDGRVIVRKHIENFSGSLSAQESSSPKRYVGSLLLEGLLTPPMSYVFPSLGHLDALDNRSGARLWSIRLAGGGWAVFTLAPS